MAYQLSKKMLMDNYIIFLSINYPATPTVLQHITWHYCANK